jgi:hypothetical protein
MKFAEDTLAQLESYSLGIYSSVAAPVSKNFPEIWHNHLSLLQNDDFGSKSRHANNFFRRHIIDIPRINI